MMSDKKKERLRKDLHLEEIVEAHPEARELIEEIYYQRGRASDKLGDVIYAGVMATGWTIWMIVKMVQAKNLDFWKENPVLTAAIGIMIVAIPAVNVWGCRKSYNKMKQAKRIENALEEQLLSLEK